MKVFQYVSIFLAGCCFAVLGIVVLLTIFGMLRDRPTTPQATEVAEIGEAIEPTLEVEPTASPVVVSPAVVSATVAAPTVLPPKMSPPTATSVQIPTSIPTPVPFLPDTSVATTIAVSTAVAQPTPLILAAATSVIKTATTNRPTELYRGPSTHFDVIGYVDAEQPLTIVAMSLAGDWYQLTDGGWIGAYVVDSLVSTDFVPTASLAAIQAAPVATSMPILTNTPIAVAIGPVATLPAVATPMPAVTPFPAYAPAQTTGLTYQQICGADESSMTDPQIAAYANQYVGQTFTGWQTWVYDVVDKSGGRYDLLLSMDERGFLWGRDIVIENIPQDLAFRLNVEQPLTLSGRIARNEVFWEGVCNPLVVDNPVLQEN